jgi:isoaspartyl peptidase/L-asparaginase-like protein (Ntn-hydrolase superfamily)
MTHLPSPARAAAVAHGGVGTPAGASDGCRAAVEVALRALAAGADPVDAAVAAVIVLEDDPRFNAGTGSVVRLDGSVQMDAAVMAPDGRFAAVAAIERVKNPVLAARALLETPQLLLVGDGATAFARAAGLADHQPQPRATDGSDTVGVVVRAADGRFAAALSTGGSAHMPRGRVGDVPIFGAGLFVGPAGAAAATGAGERIVERLLARSVHDWLAAGASAQQAALRAVQELGGAAGGVVPIGIVVVTSSALGAAADRPMAWAGRQEDGPWHGPSAS